MDSHATLIVHPLQPKEAAKNGMILPRITKVQHDSRNFPGDVTYLSLGHAGALQRTRQPRRIFD
jgi:hypothetical protein